MANKNSEWEIDATDFKNAIDGKLNNNSWSSANGENGSVSLQLGNGKIWNPSGAGSGITYHPYDPGGRYLGEKEIGGGEGGSATVSEYSQANPTPYYEVSGDLSAMNGTPGSDNHVTVKYTEKDGKMVPMEAPKNWKWEPDTSLQKLLLIAGALGIGLPALSGLFGAGAGAGLAAGELGLTAGELGLAGGTGLGAGDLGVLGAMGGTGAGAAAGAAGAAGTAGLDTIAATIANLSPGINTAAAAAGAAGTAGLDTIEQTIANLNPGINTVGTPIDLIEQTIANLDPGINYDYSNIPDYLGSSVTGPANLPFSIPKGLTSTLGKLLSPETSTGGGGGLTYIDNKAAPSGSGALRLGQMGYDTPERALQQLFSGVAPTIPNAYQYVTDEAPAMVNVMPQGNLPFSYARGGMVQHFDEGNQPKPDSAITVEGSKDDGNKDVLAALNKLGNLGFEGKIYRPTMLQQGQMGQMGGASSQKVLPQLAALLKARGMTLAEGGQPDDHAHPNYDGIPLLRTGGLSGLGGKYVEGKGDGTSDDIAAMLADGEYVFSADVVAALGNGSNKAGAEELDKMVQSIRSRARSAPPDKLPPDAKSPLEYMKSSKGKKHG